MEWTSSPLAPTDSVIASSKDVMKNLIIRTILRDASDNPDRRAFVGTAVLGCPFDRSSTFLLAATPGDKELSSDFARATSLRLRTYAKGNYSHDRRRHHHLAGTALSRGDDPGRHCRRTADHRVPHIRRRRNVASRRHPRSRHWSRDDQPSRLALGILAIIPGQAHARR